MQNPPRATVSRDHGTTASRSRRNWDMTENEARVVLLVAEGGVRADEGLLDGGYIRDRGADRRVERLAPNSLTVGTPICRR